MFKAPTANVAQSQSCLRPYQEQAVDETLRLIGEGKHPVVSAPTGSGKSRMIAALCERLNGRLLVATHRKELLTQNSAELSSLSAEDYGIYSAGLSRREKNSRIIFGGIQSIYGRMDELQKTGPFSAVIVDEAHRVAMRDSPTMYGKVFASCPDASRVGLTATPYRLDNGPIWGAGCWFDELACNISIRELTPEYLSPLRGILTAHNINLEGVRVQSGEYVLSDLSQAACEEGLVEAAVSELCRLAAYRYRWIVFCIDVAHTEAVTEALRAKGIPTGMITGKTPADEREGTIERFKAGRLRALTNCQIFCEGFNIPSVDVVALLRPTKSRGLLVQQVGRGSRQAPGKIDCVIIDLAKNLDAHAPIDDLMAEVEKTPAREKKDREKNEKKEKRERELNHDRRASLADPFGQSPARTTHRVMAITYTLEPARRYEGKQNIVATYRLSGSHKWVRSWICLEYPGNGKWHAEQFFKRRGLSCSRTAVEGIAVLRKHRLPESVVVDRGEKYPRIVMEHFGQKVPWDLPE